MIFSFQPSTIWKRIWSWQRWTVIDSHHVVAIEVVLLDSRKVVVLADLQVLKTNMALQVVYLLRQTNSVI
jgi:hypothetical protein